MNRLNPACSGSDPSERSVPADIVTKEDPEDEEDEEDEDDEEEHDSGGEDEDQDEGYSE